MRNRWFPSFAAFVTAAILITSLTGCTGGDVGVIGGEDGPTVILTGTPSEESVTGDAAVFSAEENHYPFDIQLPAGSEILSLERMSEDKNGCRTFGFLIRYGGERFRISASVDLDPDGLTESLSDSVPGTSAVSEEEYFRTLTKTVGDTDASCFVLWSVGGVSYAAENVTLTEPGFDGLLTYFRGFLEANADKNAHYGAAEEND